MLDVQLGGEGVAFADLAGYGIRHLRVHAATFEVGGQFGDLRFGAAQDVLLFFGDEGTLGIPLRRGFAEFHSAQRACARDGGGDGCGEQGVGSGPGRDESFDDAGGRDDAVVHVGDATPDGSSGRQLHAGSLVSLGGGPASDFAAIGGASS